MLKKVVLTAQIPLIVGAPLLVSTMIMESIIIGRQTLPPFTLLVMLINLLVILNIYSGVTKFLLRLSAEVRDRELINIQVSQMPQGKNITKIIARADITSPGAEA